MATKPTRAEYMAGKVAHAEYYGAMAETAGVSYRGSDPEFLGRVRVALRDGDKHLNTIPLAQWDARAMSLLSPIDDAIRWHGDIPSLAVKVCLVKEAARKAVT